jgi:hypothetical protein
MSETEKRKPTNPRPPTTYREDCPLHMVSAVTLLAVECSNTSKISSGVVTFLSVKLRTTTPRSSSCAMSNWVVLFFSTSSNRACMMRLRKTSPNGPNTRPFLSENKSENKNLRNKRQKNQTGQSQPSPNQTTKTTTNLPQRIHGQGMVLFGVVGDLNASFFQSRGQSQGRGEPSFGQTCGQGFGVVQRRQQIIQFFLVDLQMRHRHFVVAWTR